MTKPVGYLTNTLTGIEGEPGVFYDYILAAGGVYLRAKNAHLRLPFASHPVKSGDWRH